VLQDLVRDVTGTRAGGLRTVRTKEAVSCGQDGCVTTARSSGGGDRGRGSLTSQRGRVTWAQDAPAPLGGSRAMSRLPMAPSPPDQESLTILLPSPSNKGKGGGGLNFTAFVRLFVLTLMGEMWLSH